MQHEGEPNDERHRDQVPHELHHQPVRHRAGGTADGMTTEQEVRDALATFPALTLAAFNPKGGGAYVVVEHLNGGRWSLAVKTATMQAGAADVARDIAAIVAQHMMIDAMELLRPKSNVISRGREA